MGQAKFIQFIAIISNCAMLASAVQAHKGSTSRALRSHALQVEDPPCTLAEVCPDDKELTACPVPSAVCVSPAVGASYCTRVGASGIAAGCYEKANGVGKHNVKISCNKHSDCPPMYLYSSSGFCSYEPTNMESNKPYATCSIYEDPHIEGFDGGQVSLLAHSRAHFRNGNQEDSSIRWLVKNDRVSIQARYSDTENLGLAEHKVFLNAVAVGGPFLQNSVLIIGPLDREVVWKGKPILEVQESSIEEHFGEYFMKARRGNHSRLVTNSSEEHAGIDIELPLGVNLTVNRLRHHVNVAITMPRQSGGQDGLCGNFNGLLADDSLDFAAKRSSIFVAPDDSLFADSDLK